MDLATVIKILKEADRIGQPEDKPEGVRYIQISDTLVSEMIEELNSCERRR